MILALSLLLVLSICAAGAESQKNTILKAELAEARQGIRKQLRDLELLVLKQRDDYKAHLDPKVVKNVKIRHIQ